MNALERAVIAIERPLKEAVWDCKMCGQCILHSTGLTCPMRCPKNLRNGPCGGVRADGACEVFPDRPCVWVQAVEPCRPFRIPQQPADRAVSRGLEFAPFDDSVRQKVGSVDAANQSIDRLVDPAAHSRCGLGCQLLEEPVRVPADPLVALRLLRH